MKKFIQNAFSRLLLLSIFTLVGLTSFGQFNYVPGTIYTFRTFISSTQTIQIDVEFDGNDNATVTLTNVSPQSGDKAYSHIFLPTNNEYTLDQNTGKLEVTQNLSYYKKILLTNGTSTDFLTGPEYVPTCPGCNTGGGGCTLEKISTGGGCFQICCSDDLPEPYCSECHKIVWKEVKNGGVSSDPILVIRLSGNLTIQ